MRRRGRPPHPDILTPREWEVLALLRDGLSNEEIAARLGVSPSTAKFHVSEILGKLDVSSREEAARWMRDGPAGERFALLAPLVALRRLHLGWPLQLAGAAVVLAAVAGVGALAWGVRASGRSGGRQDAPVTRAAGVDPGLGMRATEAGILPWMTYRISDGDLPRPVTVPFAEYLIATDTGPALDGALAEEPAAGATTYRLEFVRADDLATPVGSPGVYVSGATPVWQGPSFGAPSTSPSWTEVPADLAAMLDRYIALARAGAVPDRPTLAESIAGTHAAGATAVVVGGRELAAADRDLFLSMFGGASPARVGVRGRNVGQRALNAAAVQVQLGAETLAFAYISPGAIAADGLLMNATRVGNWEFSALLDPPAYAQNAYTVPKQMDDLMARLGFAGGAPPPDIQTRIMPLLDADMTMRIDRVTLSDGANDVSVQDVDPDSVECAPGIDVCGPEAAPLPTDRDALTLTVWRRGVDPFPEAQQPTEYSYYPPRTAGARGVLVQTKAGAIWSATLGSDGGTPYYASPTTDAALRAAVRQLGG